MALLPLDSQIGPRPALWLLRAPALRHAAVAALCLAVAAPAYHALALSPSPGVALGPAWPVWVALAAYAVASGLAAGAVLRGYPHHRLGLCNTVTQARLALTCLVLASVLAPEVSGWVAFGLASLALALDGVDGWLARREGLTSAFGARFDMEVDSLLALSLATGAYLSGAVGSAVLLLGMARYAFWGAGLLLPWLRAELPARLSRKAVCVAQIGVLVALQAPGLPPVLAETATLAIAGALIWSFAVDIAWLWRRREREGRAAA